MPLPYSYTPPRLVLRRMMVCWISYYFPQALAQDQRTALEQLLWACHGLQHIKVATYDGDTPQEYRRSKSPAFHAQ